MIALDESAEFLTCKDTCQGQECGLAVSPFTMRVITTGGMAGFPHVLGQARKGEENHCNQFHVWLSINVCGLVVYKQSLNIQYISAARR